MNQLEKFILGNLNELNQAQPSAKVWKQLKHKMDEDQLINFIQKHRNTLDSELPSPLLWQNIQTALEETKLQEFLQENSTELDTHEPSNKLWASISAQLDDEQVPTEKEVETPVIPLKKAPKMVPLRTVWQIAAGFIILLVAVFAIQQNISTTPATTAQVEISPDLLQKIAPDLAEAEAYYTRVIHNKLGELRNFNLEGTGVDLNSFEAEINHLDSAYTGLKQDLVESQRNEQVMGAMMENLQLRIEILNRQLQILEQIQQLKDGKTDEISI